MGEEYQEVSAPPIASPQRYTVARLSTANGDLDHLVKVVSVRFTHYTSLLFHNLFVRSQSLTPC